MAKFSPSWKMDEVLRGTPAYIQIDLDMGFVLGFRSLDEYKAFVASQIGMYHDMVRFENSKKN
jgi:hypothetical protein